jgi:phosphoribosylamine--glycine ligase
MNQIETAVIGNGGREFELGRQLAMKDEVSRVYFINGNAGTEDIDNDKCLNVPIEPTDIEATVSFAAEKELDLTVIGPEAPLVAGLADRLRQNGLTVFGPGAEAAQLESSKAYATKFMRDNDIPHPPTKIVSDYEAAISIISRRPVTSLVIKADGLAGGKGVILPNDLVEAKDAVWGLLKNNDFGGAGKDRILIQDRYQGPELSVFVISDGKRFTVLPFSQDHKRLLDNDEGPNTGGMGAYAPLPTNIVNPKQEQKIYDIAERSIEGMNKNSVPYEGVLYIGLMLAEEANGDPVVIENNARFGDPESQVVLPLLSEADVSVYALLKSAAEGQLSDIKLPKNLGRSALTVCLAAEDYPHSPIKGEEIHGLDQVYESVIIHHAATSKEDSRIVTSGGRVLYVTGIGADIDEAASRAYESIGEDNHLVGFRNMQYRTDIGHQARTRH